MGQAQHKTIAQSLHGEEGGEALWFQTSAVLDRLHALTCVFRHQRTAQLNSTAYISPHIACFTLSKSKGGKIAGREKAQPIQTQCISTGTEPGQIMNYPKTQQWMPWVQPSSQFILHSTDLSPL